MMAENKFISLDDAIKKLDELMESVCEADREYLVAYANHDWFPFPNLNDTVDDENRGNEESSDDPVAMLNAIAKEIRQKVPFDAILPVEKMQTPKRGENSDRDPDITVHVDGFLYNDDEVDDLVEEGKLQRYYCQECGSRAVDSLTFISHSFSREQCCYIFNSLLPTLDDKVVFNIGSRLGAVLYGAHAYTDAERIIGVEMDKDFCQLQEEIIRKFKLDKRIEIINGRIEDAVDVLQVADVVILNNVFKFYLSKTEETNVWRFLKENIKKGAFVISRPSINVSLSKLNTGIDIEKWLKSAESLKKRHNSSYSKEEKEKEFPEIFCYTVL